MQISHAIFISSILYNLVFVSIHPSEINNSKEHLRIDYLWINNSDFKEEEELFVNTFIDAYKDQTPQSLGVKYDNIATWLRESFKEEREEINSKKSRIYFVSAKHNEKVVGFASFNETENKNEVYIRDLAVDPNYQGKGIGKHLVFIIGQLLPHTNRLVLMTRKINNRAKNFYTKKCGFKECSYVHEGLSPQRYVGYEWEGDIKQEIKQIFNKSWEQIFVEKEVLLNDPAYQTIKNQYSIFLAKESPAIAHQDIKSIPIIENNEELIDVNFMQNPRITMLPNTPNGKSFEGPTYNSGLMSASQMRLGIWKKLEKTIEHLDDLAEVFGYKKGTISIKVFEGLRDLKTQDQIFQNMVNDIKSKNPSISDEQAEIEAAKWVSPTKNNVPVHSTGAAVDIRLWNNETNDFLDLGAFGAFWGPANELPTFSQGISYHQKLNRLYLLMATSKAGLVNYSYENWHYSAGDRYAAYWLENDSTKRCANYGAIN